MNEVERIMLLSETLADLGYETNFVLQQDARLKDQLKNLSEALQDSGYQDLAAQGEVYADENYDFNAENLNQVAQWMSNNILDRFDFGQQEASARTSLEEYQSLAVDEDASFSLAQPGNNTDSMTATDAAPDSGFDFDTAQVARVQTYLAVLGHNSVDNIDGQAGKKTAEAIQNYDESFLSKDISELEQSLKDSVASMDMADLSSRLRALNLDDINVPGVDQAATFADKSLRASAMAVNAEPPSVEISPVNLGDTGGNLDIEPVDTWAGINDETHQKIITAATQDGRGAKETVEIDGREYLVHGKNVGQDLEGEEFKIEGAVDLTAQREKAAEMLEKKHLTNKVFNKAVRQGGAHPDDQLKDYVRVDGETYRVNEAGDGNQFKMEGYEKVDTEQATLSFESNGKTYHLQTSPEILEQASKDLRREFRASGAEGRGIRKAYKNFQKAMDDYQDAVKDGNLESHESILRDRFNDSSDRTYAELGPDGTKLELDTNVARTLAQKVQELQGDSMATEVNTDNALGM